MPADRYDLGGGVAPHTQPLQDRVAALESAVTVRDCSGTEIGTEDFYAVLGDVDALPLGTRVLATEFSIPPELLTGDNAIEEEITYTLRSIRQPDGSTVRGWSDRA